MVDFIDSRNMNGSLIISSMNRLKKIEKGALLFQAIEKQDIQEVKSLLDDRETMHLCVNDEERYPWEEIIVLGNNELLDAYIYHEQSFFRIRNKDGQDPVEFAMSHGNKYAAKLIATYFFPSLSTKIRNELVSYFTRE